MASFLEIFGDDQHILPNSFKRDCKIVVFGYGSILWKTDFKYGSKRRGFIQGFQRRFWQGNITHRGTVEKPGRCATLVPSAMTEKVWGVAYEIRGLDQVSAAWDSLYSRECRSGGYAVEVASFHPGDCHCSPDPVLVFRATPECDLYAGESPEYEIANGIFDSKGPSGYNIEYVVLLYEYIEKYFPQGMDDHLSKMVGTLESIATQRDTHLNVFLTETIPSEEEYRPCEQCS